jgi:hypothetical protein
MVGWNTVSIVNAIRTLCPSKEKKAVDNQTTFSQRVAKKLNHPPK